jgi:hypothetical protein
MTLLGDARIGLRVRPDPAAGTTNVSYFRPMAEGPGVPKLGT